MALSVAVGDAVSARTTCWPSWTPQRPAEESPPAEDAPPAAVREDLRQLRERQALLRDEARPEAVARRHAAGRRTVREDLADLLDPGTWVEYGGLVVAAQRARRSEQELRSARPPTAS